MRRKRVILIIKEKFVNNKFVYCVSANLTGPRGYCNKVKHNENQVITIAIWCFSCYLVL